MNMFSLLERTARRWPQAGAVFSGPQQLLSWDGLHRRALLLAGGIGRRCGPAGRIALISPNAPALVELMFGTWAAQCAIVPINAKLHPREMAQILDDCDPALVFVAPSLAAGLRDALARPFHARLVEIGSPACEALLDGEPARPGAGDPLALAWLFYTSGTTGRSKGAMLSHRNLMAMTLAHLADVEAIDEGCSQVHAAPMSHGSGMYIPASVARGARQVIPASQGFDPGEVLDLCDAHPRCGMFLAPTMVQRLRMAAQERGRVPAGLRSIVYGGGPMYVEELKKSQAVFGHVFAQIYGQGESPMTITWLAREDHLAHDDAALGSVGLARTGVEVRVVDGTGHAVPAGEIGEVVCRGDVVMQGYWRNEAATAQALRDGWLYTGDMGTLDARGYLTLRDRSKDVVISGGSNIYPREVEEVLVMHPGVAEACVVGEFDAEWGEVVVAFVVPAGGRHLTADALDAHCLDHLARFKRPRRYEFVAALPKNSYGKVLKRELRERLGRPPDRH